MSAPWRLSLTIALVSFRQAGSGLPSFATMGKYQRSPTCALIRIGPLGEGKIIDGCVTCPWHGYQYLPDFRGFATALS
jgi:hypothetical protein